MRVLHLYGGNLYGGVERFLVSLQRFRALTSMEPVFGLCFHARIWQELESEGAALHDLGAARLSRPWQVRAARRRLRQWLAQEPVSVAVCHAWWSYIIFGPALRAAGVPVALWAHDTAYHIGWLERWAGRRQPDLLITASEYMARSLPGLFPRLAPLVLGYPLAPPPPMDAAHRAQTRRELGAEENTVVILMPSRLERWKGHELLLQALAQLPPHLDWRAWLGSWAQRPKEQAYLAELQQLAHRLGIEQRLSWLGPRGDLAHLAVAADIFCQPNTTPEPYGMVFLEGLAAGLPVVATSGGGAGEIVTSGCGRLVAADPAAVAAALTDFLAHPDLRRQESRNARERARQLADPQRQMSRLARALEALAA